MLLGAVIANAEIASSLCETCVTEFWNCAVGSDDLLLSQYPKISQTGTQRFKLGDACKAAQVHTNYRFVVEGP